MKTPVEIGDVIDLKIEDMNNQGEGIGRYKGYAVFVPGAITGEKARCRVISTKKSYCRATILEQEYFSSERVTPFCRYYEECGGCQLQHLSYEGQLKFKQKRVVDSIEKIGKIHPGTYELLPILKMDNPWFYRNKIQLPVRDGGGYAELGFYKKGSHQLVGIDSCMIQDKRGNMALNEVRKIINKYNFPAYNEREHSGLLRHVVIRVGVFTGEIHLVFVTRKNEFPFRKRITAELSEKIPGLVGITHNINPGRTNVILGDKDKTIWGRSYVRDRLGDLEFNISPRAFYQVNSYQAERLYKRSVEISGIKDDYKNSFEDKQVVDAYSGIGTMTLFFASYAEKVVGMEVVEDAVRDAEENAMLNGLMERTEFYQGEVEKLLPELSNKNKLDPGIIIFDPPRKGCEESFLKEVLKCYPEKIVYISCNPSTLARDLDLIVNEKNKNITGGSTAYELKKVQPVDMFPHTIHVETIALLELA